MSTVTSAAVTGDVAARLRRVLSSIDLQCGCRTALDGALDRFTAIENEQRLRKGVREACRQRDWIAARLVFLADLDELMQEETDDSVFEEMALLFEEIAGEAEEAAETLREIRALVRERAAKA